MKVDVEAPRVEHLRHQEDVGEGDAVAEQEAAGARRGERLKPIEPLAHPMPVPIVARRLIDAEAGKMLQHAQIVERMDVAGDGERKREDMGARQGSAGRKAGSG